ncbi:MAG TPA: dienelactone hydrolase family protein, partial [Acidobacteriaceae bacterium]|nr:dienelactone hydrolase family protein [Acidobacteriaceae bacterium]
EEVIDLLQRSGEPARRTLPAAEWASNADQDEVSIDAGGVSLQGTLTVPREAKGVILFVHGSGSSRHSPRNRRVAGILQSHGFATLLFDLLTQDEEDLDQKSAELRFDIDLLTKRLVGATHWIAKHASTAALSIGYFGASTGAAAALAAAAFLRDRVAAIVSRGGRPDLAADALGKVRAPVLLLVGGKDEMVITLNRYALDRLQSPVKHLAIIPGATHLFEEPGKLDQVAAMASDWFARYLVPDRSEKAAGHTRVSGAR